MNRRMVSVVMMLLLLLATLNPLASAGGRKAGRTPPAPVPLEQASGELSIALSGGGSGGTPGTIYIGATPPNVDYSKPVLLFVHGKGGSASTWWTETAYHGTNDMYAYAYYNGYRTAFVDLYPEESMWDNGALLNQLIDRVKAYFGVSKVAIVAHSKGGVDANAAAVYYGAGPKISRTITLGSPHWGTPLADMAFSTWTWWLAALMGETTEATYVMQTGYMEWFRSETDPRPDPVPYYTISGYKCGPLFSALWYGCVAISGEDDGVVPVWSARKPGATHLKEGYWDHDEIRMGSRTWSTFAPVITTASADGPAVAGEGPLLAMAGSAPLAGQGRPQAPGNLILRGGEVTGSATGQGFPIESGVRSATFLFYASSPDFTATLTGPDGSAHQVTVESQVPAGEIFGSTWVGSLTVTAPTAGAWSLQTSAADRTGYLMVASLESPLQATLDLGHGPSTPGTQRKVAVRLTGPQVQESSARAALSRSGGAPAEETALSGERGDHRASLAVGTEQTVRNITVTLTGKLADGSAFERTLVSSFAVVAQGQGPGWLD
ncbi:MAG: esterase/lipase family protein [Bacillota bacterium]